MAESFRLSGVPFTISTIVYSENWNWHDISFAIDWCKQYGIKQNLIKCDVIKFWESSNCFDIGYAIQSRSPQFCIHAWGIDQVEGFPVLAYGEGLLQRRKQGDELSYETDGEYLRVCERHLIVRNRNGVASFFKYTPELKVCQFIDDSFINWANDPNTNKNIKFYKNEICQKHFPNLETRPPINSRYGENYTDYNGSEFLPKIAADSEDKARSELMRHFQLYHEIIEVEYNTQMKRLLTDELFDEFIVAAQEVFPGILIQLEDFGNMNAFRLLEQYRGRACLFDDDIQGTGAVAVSGIIGALRITGSKLSEQRLLFLGAGEAGIGIADTFVAALAEEGIPTTEAREQCWFVDSQGLLAEGREKIALHKQRYVREQPPVGDFLEAVKTLKPTAILGLSGQPGSFTQEIIEAMAEINDRPIIFALSNPTSKAECTAEQTYGWTNGRAIFASGSPFDPVKLGNRTFVPGQGNNAYIFPGVGLGVIVSRSREVTDEMFLAAAHSLAKQVTDSDLERGRVYPPLSQIRNVSALIALEVAKIAWSEGLADREEPEDILAEIRKHMYLPVYPHYA